MGAAGALKERAAGGWRFVRQYGQHLPHAGRALFAMRCSIVPVRGTLRGGGPEATVLYAGRGMNRAYLLPAVFDDWREGEERRTNLIAFGKHLQAAAPADAVLLDVGWPYHGGPRRRGGWLEVPDWLSMAVDLDGDWESVVARFRRTARRHDLRLIRRNAYRCEVAPGRAALERFYDDVYLPFVRHRHDADSLTAPKAHVVRRGLAGTLLQVMRGDELVAAGIVYPEGDLLFSLWMGVPSAHLDDPPEAAISALYYFGLRHAFDNGYRAFDLTGTRAFLNDGALQFKRRWGPVIEDTFSPSSVLVRPQPGSARAVELCRRVPVLARTAAGLEGVVVTAAGETGEEALAAAVKNFGCAGIDRITLISCAPGAAPRVREGESEGFRYRLIECPADDFADRYVNL